MSYDTHSGIERIEALATVEPHPDHTVESVHQHLRAEGHEPIEIDEANRRIKVILATGDQCSNCKFYLAKGDTPQAWGFCRRFPPVVGDTPTKLGVYPVTLSLMWCGEYVAKVKRDAN